MSTDGRSEEDDVVDEESASIRSDGDGSSSKGDAIVGSIRYVSCSVAGSDPLEHPKENDNEGKLFLGFFCFVVVMISALVFGFVRDDVCVSFFLFPRFVYISVSCIRLRGRVREQSFNPLCLNGWFLSKVQFIYFF